MSEAKTQFSCLLMAQGVGLCLPLGRWLFQDLDFSLSSGEALFIFGPNGSGKTTLARIMAGESLPTTGQIKRSIEPQKVAYLPQVQNDQIHVPITLKEMAETMARRSLSSDEILAGGLLELSQLSLNWNSASGGERRRSLLAGCLLSNPKVMVLDEPFNHLDRASRYQVAKSLKGFLEQGGALVLVTHEMDVIKASGFPPTEVIHL